MLLPGPFLELDTASFRFDDLSVDQLAALWNGECDGHVQPVDSTPGIEAEYHIAPHPAVFTKVGDSLHKGRRLENFVWRAWHREAHLVSLFWYDPLRDTGGCMLMFHSLHGPYVPFTTAAANRCILV